MTVSPTARRYLRAARGGARGARAGRARGGDAGKALPVPCRPPTFALMLPFPCRPLPFPCRPPTFALLSFCCRPLPFHRPFPRFCCRPRRRRPTRSRGWRRWRQRPARRGASTRAWWTSRSARGSPPRRPPRSRPTQRPTRRASTAAPGTAKAAPFQRKQRLPCVSTTPFSSEIFLATPQGQLGVQGRPGDAAVHEALPPDPVGRDGCLPRPRVRCGGERPRRRVLRGRGGGRGPRAGRGTWSKPPIRDTSCCCRPLTTYYRPAFARPDRAQAAEHNGHAGRVLRFDPAKGRFGVCLAGSLQVLAVKPANLIAARSACSRRRGCCHSSAPPSPSSRCFNRDDEGVPAQ